MRMQWRSGCSAAMVRPSAQTGRCERAIERAAGELEVPRVAGPHLVGLAQPDEAGRGARTFRELAQQVGERLRTWVDLNRLPAGLADSLRERRRDDVALGYDQPR